MTLDEFFQDAQSAVIDWGKIIQSTGGFLKPSKCFWYLLARRWHRGKPKLCSFRQLPRYRMVILQKDGSYAPIPLHDVNHVEETLGIWSCPTGDFGVHIEKKMTAGHLWVARLRSNKWCPPADGWLGFRYSLIPQLTYGFSAITPDISSLEASFHKLYRDVLSPLRVNWNISRFFRMAPRRVMGLAMPNPSIVMLSHKIHLLHTQWNQPMATGQMLRQAFEVFLMEVGLSTNVLLENFDRLGCLATHGWWKHLWELAHRYDTSIDILPSNISFPYYGPVIAHSWML